MSKFLLYIFVVFFLSTRGYSQLDSTVREFLAKHKIPGLTVVAIQGDHLFYSESFGLANIQTGERMTDSTFMEIGSLSKLFTAELVYSLQSEGLLSVQDTLGQYFPKAPKSWHKITILQLLQHTSGIQNYLLHPRYLAGDYFLNTRSDMVDSMLQSCDRNQMVASFFSLPLEFMPGSSWSYSNTGYYLLGKICEMAGDSGYFELLQKHLFSPLGITTIQSNDRIHPSLPKAIGYRYENSQFHKARPLTDCYGLSAGSLSATSQSLATWFMALHRDALPSSGTEFSWRKAPETMDTLPFIYQGGKFYATVMNTDFVYHNGGTPGFTSSWFCLPQQNTSIILFSNVQDNPAIDQLGIELLSLFLPTMNDIKGKPILHGYKMSKKLMELIHTIKGGKPIPSGLVTTPLSTLLATENGRGIWYWYFSNGWPEMVRCIHKEKNGAFTSWLFEWIDYMQQKHILSVLSNPKNEIVQIRWL